MENSNKTSDLIDISGIIKKYLKSWPLFVVSIIVCGALSIAYIKLKKDTYAVKASMLISQESSKGSGTQLLMKSFSFGSLMGGRGSVDDEINFVWAHSTLRAVVKELGLNKTHILYNNFFDKKDLYKDYPVEVYAATPTIEDTLSCSLKFKVSINEKGHIKTTVSKGFKTLAKTESERFPFSVSTPYGDFILNTTSYYEPGEKMSTHIVVRGYDLTVEKFSELISISIPYKKSNLIQLETEEKNIERGKDLLNGLIAQYNARGIEQKNQEAEQKAKFIDERIVLVMQELSETEKQIEAYKKDHNLTDIGTEAKIMLEQNTQLKEKRIETESQIQMISIIEEFLAQNENRYELIPFNPSLADATVVNAIKQYNELILKRIEITYSARESNQAVIVLNQQIDASRKNVIETLQGVKESLDIVRAILQEQEDEFIGRIKDIPTQEREFIDMQRQQTIKQELFLFLLQQREENALTLSMTMPKGEIVDEAYNMSEPTNAPKMIILLAGLMMGFILPIIYLYLKGLLQTKFATRAELEALTSIPVLGEISAHKNKEQHIVIHEGDNSSIAELFRLTRNNIQFILNGRDEKVILITSSISGEGKSFIGCNLAMSIALLGKRVLLIGMDIRNPRLGQYIGLHHAKGLTNYLADTQTTIEDILIPDAMHKGLDVILGGPVPPNPSELLLNSRVDELFALLRERYDYIIIDSAPVGMVSDTFSLARISDATIYVCRANYTDKEHLRYINRIVNEKRLNKVSIILNGTEARQGYGYGSKE